MSNIYELFDPWEAPLDSEGGQSSRLKAYCQISITYDGNVIDVTNRLAPYLISVTVYDGGPLKCDIELDDRDAELPIPPLKSQVTVTLGWQGGTSRQWTFWINDIEHGFGRKQGGRRMWVHCSAENQQFTRMYTPMQDHLGEGAPPGSQIGTPINLGQWLSQVAGNAGCTALVHPTLAALTRDYWAQVNESAVHHFQRMAYELGAMTRIENGNQFVFTMWGQPVNEDPGGTFMITAKWGVNLISWRVHPWYARTSWTGATQQYYDHLAAQYTQLDKQFGWPVPFGGGDEVFALPAPAPNANVATQQNDQGYYNASVGSSRIMINGEPDAAWGGYVQMVGARAGVDGLYHISEADHTYSRQGYVTTLFCETAASAPAAQNVGNLGYPQGPPPSVPPQPPQPPSPQPAPDPNTQ